MSVDGAERAGVLAGPVARRMIGRGDRIPVDADGQPDDIPPIRLAHRSFDAVACLDRNAVFGVQGVAQCVTSIGSDLRVQELTQAIGQEQLGREIGLGSRSNFEVDVRRDAERRDVGPRCGYPNDRRFRAWRSRRSGKPRPPRRRRSSPVAERVAPFAVPDRLPSRSLPASQRTGAGAPSDCRPRRRG